VHHGVLDTRELNFRKRERKGELLISIVRRYPLISFFVLACAFAWPTWLLMGLYPGSTAYIPSPTFGPLIAALIVLPLTRGKSRVKDLLSRMVRWRVGVHW